MKNVLHATSRRHGYDGWALRVHGANDPLKNTMCTTREEARALRLAKRNLVDQVDVVKVRLVMEVIE